MKQSKRIEIDTMAPKAPDGRDELNLAEFPLSALSHRLKPDQKTIQFEDQIRDDGQGEVITRKLTITGSDAYGLPRALDDEVLLGLIQLTRAQGFTERKVPFSRYQLIQLLGWRNETKSYERVEVSLNRWTGVTLYYQNAWRNLAAKCWMSEKFHVLDNVWLCHRPELAVVSGRGESKTLGSAFVWNEVLFQSFRAGNLKAIDFEFFKGLQSAIAKRLYRFLDKRFFHKEAWEFGLNELAWEHVGLARSYDAASLKRKLLPAIVELEQKGFIQPLPEEARFKKARAGQWLVRFEKSVAVLARVDSPALATAGVDLEAELLRRGVNPTTIRKILAECPAEQIETQLGVFDWMTERRDKKLSRNPPGFLVSAIRGNYELPQGFVSRGEQERKRNALDERDRKQAARKQSRAQKEEDLATERDKMVEGYMRDLSPEERLQTENEAVRQSSSLEYKLITGGGSAAAAAKGAAIKKHVLRLLRSKPA